MSRSGRSKEKAELTELEIKAGKTILGFFQKHVLVEKWYLLPDKFFPQALSKTQTHGGGPSQTQTSAPAPSQTPSPEQVLHKADVDTLFENVTPDTKVRFNKQGYRKLFPRTTAGKTSLDRKVLTDRLETRREIRRDTLEAYLRQIITKDTFISLFLLQEAIIEFWPNLKLLQEHKPLRIFPIHEIQEGTNSVRTTLSAATENILIPHLQTTSSPIAKEPENAKNFMTELRTNLITLDDTANYFTVLEIPTKQLMITAYYMLVYHLQEEMDINKFQEKIAYAIPFLKLAADKVRFSLTDIEEHPKEVLTALLTNISAAILTIMKKKDNSLNSNNFARYMAEHVDFYSYLILSIPEFLPIVSVDKANRPVAAILIMNCETQSAWIKATLGRDPESVVRKKPMFNEVSVQQINDSTSAPFPGRFIGLHIPGWGFGIPDEVHGSKTEELSYTLHDLKFHYQLMVFLLVLAQAAYQLQLQFVKIIRDVTGHQRNYIINHLLDFTASYYIDQYNGKHDIEHQLKNYPLIYTNDKDARFALLEYAFIVISDILKNPQTYQPIFNAFPNQPKHPSEKTNLDILMHSILRYFGVNFAVKIKPYAKEISEYSPSLGAFMCMLLHIRHSKNDTEKRIQQVRELCHSLHQLEVEGIVKFKWNLRDGMMLDFETEDKIISFRFRHPKKDDDYRHEKVYKQDESPGKKKVERKFSNDPHWFDELSTLAMSQLVSRKRQPNIT